jgi:hypothetical protein
MGQIAVTCFWDHYVLVSCAFFALSFLFFPSDILLSNCKHLVPYALARLCLLPFDFAYAYAFAFALAFALCLVPCVFCLLPFAFCLLPFAFCLLPFAFCLCICLCLFPEVA